MIITGPIEKFFRAPGSPWPESDKGEGLLYNLRDDLTKLYGPETDFAGQITEGFFLPLAGIMSGIDYLAKAYRPAGRSGDRFVNTLRELGGMNEDNAEAIYQLRCALVHEISLQSISDRAARKGVPYKFYLNGDPAVDFANGGGPIVQIADKAQDAPPGRIVYVVNFWGMKQLFLRMVSALRRICEVASHQRHAEVLNRVAEMSRATLLEVSGV